MTNDLTGTTLDRSLAGSRDAAQACARKQNALVSVIICTHGRKTSLLDLLNALNEQTYGHLETLVVDGNDEPSPARETVEKFLRSARPDCNVTLIKSPKGLTCQRNVGLQAAQGELICFFDDDVTFDKDFFHEVVGLFERPEMKDVGGITPYDTLHYPLPLTMRWKLRAFFGVMPGLEPGRVDRIGRAVPVAFLKPWPGHKEIGWLPGFCMIYRRSAVEGVWFDETLPTYGGEDRDFSMRIGASHRLLICGDIHVQHHYTVEGRADSLSRLRESSFGTGVRFTKYARTFADYLAVLQTFAGDFVVDIVALMCSPKAANLWAPFVRVQECVRGMKIGREARIDPPRPIRRNCLRQEQNSIAGQGPIAVSSQRDN